MRQRCALRQAHVGQHLRINTRSTTALLGECQATPPRPTSPAPPSFRVQELAAVGPEGRLEFRIQRKLRTPNEYLGMHWREKGRERKAWTAHFANALITALGVPCARALLGPGAPLIGCDGGCTSRRRIEVIRWAPTPRNFIRDDDNLRFTVKPLLDALKHLGVIRDDHRKWLEVESPTQDMSHDGTFWTWVAVDQPRTHA